MLKKRKFKKYLYRSAGRTNKKFWPKVLRKKGNSELRNILSFVKILLVLICSTTCVKRGFSFMNRVQSDWRCNFKEESLNSLMHALLPLAGSL